MDYATHESWGTVVVSKPQGNDKQLFGSDATHHSWVRLTISNADRSWDLGRSWIHPRSQSHDLITIDMSYDQWATMICSFGVGEGTPCTLSRVNGELVEYVPPPAELQEYAVYANKILDDLSEKATTLEQRIADLIEGKGKAGKKDLEALKQEVSVLGQHVGGNYDFLMSSFTQHVETEMNRAKVNIASYTGAIVTQYGIEAALGQLKKPMMTLDA
jgi:hypothetical protein